MPASTKLVCLTVLNVLRQYVYAKSFKQRHGICYTIQLSAEMHLHAIDLMVVVHMHCSLPHGQSAKVIALVHSSLGVATLGLLLITRTKYVRR